MKPIEEELLRQGYLRKGALIATSEVHYSLQAQPSKLTGNILHLYPSNSNRLACLHTEVPTYISTYGAVRHARSVCLSFAFYWKIWALLSVPMIARSLGEQVEAYYGKWRFTTVVVGCFLSVDETSARFIGPTP